MYDSNSFLKGLSVGKTLRGRFGGNSKKNAGYPWITSQPLEQPAATGTFSHETRTITLVDDISSTEKAQGANSKLICEALADLGFWTLQRVNTDTFTNYDATYVDALGVEHNVGPAYYLHDDPYSDYRGGEWLDWEACTSSAYGSIVEIGVYKGTGWIAYYIESLEPSNPLTNGLEPWVVHSPVTACDIIAKMTNNIYCVGNGYNIKGRVSSHHVDFTSHLNSDIGMYYTEISRPIPQYDYTVAVPMTFESYYVTDGGDYEDSETIYDPYNTQASIGAEGNLYYVFEHGYLKSTDLTEQFEIDGHLFQGLGLGVATRLT